AGTYVPTRIEEDYDYILESNRFPSFQLKNNVTIYGGFPADAANGEGMSSRDWTVHETILSGHPDGTHMPSTADGSLLEGREDNSRSVFIHPASLQLNETAILDGVTITGGTTGNTVHLGAGMFNDGSIEEDGTVIGNDPLLRNVTITENIAFVGGGIYNGPGSHLTLDNVTVSHNNPYTRFVSNDYPRAGTG